MCAGGNESRACEGDSGGPLINSEDVDGQQRYVQHGIISLGPRYLFGFDPKIDIWFTKININLTFTIVI